MPLFNSTLGGNSSRRESACPSGSRVFFDRGAATSLSRRRSRERFLNRRVCRASWRRRQRRVRMVGVETTTASMPGCWAVRKTLQPCAGKSLLGLGRWSHRRRSATTFSCDACQVSTRRGRPRHDGTLSRRDGGCCRRSSASAARLKPEPCCRRLPNETASGGSVRHGKPRPVVRPVQQTQTASRVKRGQRARSRSRQTFV